jgi:DNA-binding response OmpR family regulator
MKSRIMVVSDDAALRATLARWLMADGYRVELAESLKHARQVAANSDLALAVVGPLAPSLGPGLGAADLARELDLEVKRLIVIDAEMVEIATATQPSEEADRSNASSRQDLQARVKAALGGEVAGDEALDPRPLRFEGYTLDPGGRTCHDASGEEIPLTRAELSLLLVFARQPGRVLSRDTLRRAAAGRGAEPDDRSVDMLISRLRRKIEPSPRSPRMIVTVPGEGYRFAAKPQVSAVARETPAARSIDVAPIDHAAAGASPAAVAPAGQRHPIGGRRTSLLERAAVLAIAAGLIIAVWYPRTTSTPTPAPVAQTFDAADVPLVSDDVRAELASYSTRPDFKAIAISADGWGMAIGAANREAAEGEAVERCKARTKAVTVCRVYASGAHVLWSRGSLPLPRPADLRSEPLDIRFVAAAMPSFDDAQRRQLEDYAKSAEHKAMAVSSRGNALWRFATSSRADAVRTAVERCGDVYQIACLLVSVDGMMTVQIPQSRRVAGIFMIATEADMTEPAKRQVEQVYQGKEWRALARGNSRAWYPVADAPSESAAVEAALALCRKSDSDCKLYAIGNFRVIEEK